MSDRNLPASSSAGTGSRPTPVPHGLVRHWLVRPVARRAVLTALLLAVLVAPALLLAGCGSTGTTRSKATQSGMAGLRTDLTRLVKDLDEAGWGLDGILEPGDRGLRAAYDTFLVRLGRLEAQTAQVKTSYQSFRASSEDYLEQWGREIQAMRNPSIRSGSEQRHREVEAEFARVRTHIEAAHAVFDAAHADFQDIVLALDNDLTPSGVDALSGAVAESRETAGRAKTEIEGIVAELDSLAASMSSGPAPAAAER